ncbi:uncharacterized protein ATC70_009694 [Mucor velutinosus]|uniref:F-box domain-containing protein n=1 Tax=Mucor velutinosus TaxID=708070 RepID=A0AAN7I2Q5_9FUNG|nr:hypothetical protein ATC70_009694 [Mucor velutinosus]
MAFTDLAPEIIQAILDCLEAVQDLAECRLVCKAWKPISEQLMLRKKIFLMSEENVLQLVYHLKKAPPFGKLVKYVVFDFQENATANDVYLKLLSFIFTPNLLVLDGYIPIKNIYKEMLSIARESPKKFDKLQVIPQEQHMAINSNDFKTACLLFKKSLKVVTITFTDENKPNWTIGSL